MTQLSISSVLDLFKEKKVLVIGDLMIDSYLVGSTDRISPEAPIPVVSISDIDNRLGGAANVALNIKSLGAEAILCSVIGDDDNGKLAIKLLKENNLDNSGIIEEINRKTTVKTRIISNNQHLLRVDNEQTNLIHNDTSQLLFKRITEICDNENIDAVIFEDYDKGVLSQELITNSILYFNEKNIFTSVDPKKRNFNSYNNISLFKPNIKEFAEGIKLDIDKYDIDKIVKYSKEFIKQNNIKNMLITLSENGAFAVNSTSSKHVKSKQRFVSDVSGAGDTVISIVTLCYTCGVSLENCLKIANIAGGIVCEKSGVVSPQINEIKAKLHLWDLK